MAMGRLLEKPKMRELIPVPTKPDIMIGFRPSLSLSLPHMKPVMNSAKTKAEMIMPAYMEIWFLSSVMPKSSTML